LTITLGFEITNLERVPAGASGRTIHVSAEKAI